MALLHSPSIVRNGMVLYYDTANTKSYSYSENLFTNSNDFTTWSKQSSTATSLPVVALNTTTTISPDGTFNANLFTTDYVGGSTFYSIYRGGITISAGTYYTYSVYMKAKEVFTAGLTVFDGTYNNYITYNLNLGTITAVYTGSSNFTTTNYTLTPVGNGWYRAVFPFSHSIGGGSFQFKIDPGTTNTSSGIYLYGVQIQKSPYIGSYTPTTTTAINPSSTWIDLSGKGNLGTSANITYEPYNMGSMVAINGGISRTASAGDPLDLTTQGSINAWVKPTQPLSTASYYYIVAKNSTGGYGDHQYAVEIPPGQNIELQ
jgi:hypothetical protein